MRIAFAVVCVLFAGLAVQTAHADDIQMLPPTNAPGVDPKHQPCSMQGNQVLVLNGTGAANQGSAINCDYKFTADPASGDVNITGNSTITGDMSLTGTTTMNGRTTINGFTSINGSTKIAGRLFTGLDDQNYFWIGPPTLDSGPYYPHAFGYHFNGAYIDFSQLGGAQVLIDHTLSVGDFVIPNPAANSLYIGGVGPLDSTHATALQQLQASNCGPYQALTRNARTGNINCIDITQLLTSTGTVIGTTIMPACQSGQTLTSLDGVNFSCVAPPAQIANMTCPSGQYVAGFSGGLPVCSSLPGTPVNGLCGTAISTVNTGPGYDYLDSVLNSGNPQLGTLCIAGTANTVLNGRWTCTSSNGGTTAGCTIIQNPQIPANGVCGNVPSGTYAHLSELMSSTTNFCSVGAMSSAVFVTSGQTVYPPTYQWMWVCGGINGGAYDTCYATRTPPVWQYTNSYTAQFARVNRNSENGQIIDGVNVDGGYFICDNSPSPAGNACNLYDSPPRTTGSFNNTGVTTCTDGDYPTYTDTQYHCGWNPGYNDNIQN